MERGLAASVTESPSLGTSEPARLEPKRCQYMDRVDKCSRGNITAVEYVYEVDLVHPYS
jgi:hypothetical protein